MDKPLDAGQVAAYLRDHPTFFHTFPELLEHLSVPHPKTGQAISLLECQVMQLRARKTQLEAELEGLVAIAGDNGRLFNRMHQLNRAMMAARSEEAAVAALLTGLQNIFGLEQVRLLSFEVPARPVAGLQQLGISGRWKRLLQTHLQVGQPRCGPLEPEWQAGLFEPMPAIASVCVVPLGFERVWGALALGSGDPARFSPALDTYFLRLLGELISARLAHLFGDASSDVD
ncbi:MAG TPA: DUF484 family protein [Piscirickettsiaceae bacterium]|nr:DUF484 family protein [Piscirickettsiaceae bacterium]